MGKLEKIIRKVICRYKGHKMSMYAFQTGYWSYDVEQAGFCERCGYDTHEGVKEYGE